MANLYEITERYNNLLELLDNEETTEDVLSSALNDVQDEFNEKALNIVKFIKNLESDVNGLDAEEKRLKAKKMAYKNKIDGLKKYLENGLIVSGFKKLDLGVFNISIAKNPASVNILDEKLIDKKYLIEQEPKIDKKAILNDLKNNIDVKGCEIHQAESLRIK